MPNAAHNQILNFAHPGEGTEDSLDIFWGNSELFDVFWGGPALDDLEDEPRRPIRDRLRRRVIQGQR